MSARGSWRAAAPRPGRCPLPAWVSLVALTTACGRGLPSLEPLGRGPLAEDEPARVVARSDRRAPRASAEVGPPAPVVSVAVDAGAEADAGAPLAAGEADAGAPAPDAGRADVAPVILAGEYRGPDYAIHRLDGVMERRDDDPGARTRVEVGRDPAIRVVIVSSDTGESLCDLEATARGAEATVAGGQPCDLHGDVSSSTVREGKAVFTGRRLVLELLLDFTLELEDGPHAGETEYRFDGKLL